MATATIPITGDPDADKLLVTDPLALVRCEEVAARARDDLRRVL